MHTGVWLGKMGEREHLENPGVDGMIIFRWFFRKWDDGHDWIDLAKDRDR
jgi:hypothetical protein